MTSPALFDLVVPTTPDHIDTQPADVPHYLLFANDKHEPKIFLHKPTRLGRVLVPARDPIVHNLQTLDATAFWWSDVPPMDPTLLDSVLAFFRAVYEQNRSEAIVLLTLDENDGWHAHAPYQQVGPGHLSWRDDIALPEDETIVGSIHSHADFGAFHSGTDEADAARNDGLHITIGNVTDPAPSIDIMTSFHRIRWPDHVTVEMLLGGPWDPRPAAFPEAWLDTIHTWTPPTQKITNSVPKGKPLTDADKDDLLAYYDTLADDYYRDTYYRDILEPDPDPDAYDYKLNQDDMPRWISGWYSDNVGQMLHEARHDLGQINNALSHYGFSLTWNIREAAPKPPLKPLSATQIHTQLPPSV